MRRHSAFAIALLFAGGVCAAVPQQQQQQLDMTLQDLARSKENEAQLKKRMDATEKEMEAMRERSAGIAERLQISERRLTTDEDTLAEVNADVAAKRKEFEDRKSDYTKTVMSLLRMHSLPPTAMFASGEDTQTMLQTASVLEKTNQAVAAKAMHLRADIAELKRLQNDAKARDTATQAEKASLKVEQETLARELTQRQALQAKLNADHSRAEIKVAELSRTSQSLQDLIAKLAENEKTQIKEPTAPKPKLRDFSGSKGSAHAPVAGQVIHRFGDKQNANATYHGMVFKARAGATVVSPYDGEIVFTGPFRDYGNMVLIKHKNGYISLIAGLGKVNATLNQAAIRGEPIGTMPESGNGEAYVELRDSDAKPIDPADWFANVVAN